MGKYVERECRWCKKNFQALAKEVNRGKGLSCSVSCANAVRSAARKDPESRAKWLAANKGTPHFVAQRRAHHIVENEILRKRLTRLPCEKCGTKESVHAHHEDYAKPLDVKWLCVAHHRQHHG
jgi:hypothetical protein